MSHTSLDLDELTCVGEEILGNTIGAAQVFFIFDKQDQIQNVWFSSWIE